MCVLFTAHDSDYGAKHRQKFQNSRVCSECYSDFGVPQLAVARHSPSPWDADASVVMPTDASLEIQPYAGSSIMLTYDFGI